MASQLHADCLGEIFEYLRGDEVTLRSCLLVNHLWCEGSVRILWARIQNYNTLVACLPSESKEILFKSFHHNLKALIVRLREVHQDSFDEGDLYHSVIL